ncbi:LysE family transporter [Neobacillus sp. PS3-40]|uniref:LysE family transporter n=1 Tax=Neobacillus sp. PS3-40 TaxID=3070679 RepID=UPI0027DF8840|nr:LysE family transporter [Neobacillus sp. PS3-40]WML44718.1 LysE family transporter [Neobacillus sp. PS3-40]
MEDLVAIIHFIVLGLSLAAPIGPMNIEVFKRGLTEGLLSSWLVGLGGMSGDMILLISILFGFRDFMQSTVILYLMYSIGIVMLSYLGITSIFAALNSEFSNLEFARRKSQNAFLAGFTISLANPISLVFWFGVYGTSLQVVTSTHSIIYSMFCSLGIILGLFLWNLNLVLTVHFSKRIINEKIMRGITLFAGITLLCFGIQFIVRFIELLF